MIGNVVGNFKITAKIGEGGMGAVFKGIDLMLEREVAIKMLRPELACQAAVVERFRTEAVTLAKLNHPYIAMLHSFFRQGNDYFMVMEYVRGETLDSALRRNGAMSVQGAVALFCQALEGIEQAHKLGIIHRDIKPANMMLTEAGSIKVMDFGIARVLGSARMTRQGNVIGTIEYMSPEQVRGEETDARSDVYSLGILLYEMLTGRVPFNSKSEYELMRSQIEDAPPPPTTFSAHIPFDVEKTIMRSLAKRPEARYRSAGEFRSVLLGSGVEQVSPVAPPREAEPLFANSSGEVIKETRLGTAAEPAASQVQLKETRLGEMSEAQPGYSEAASLPVAAEPATAQPAPASLLAKLNWKHYAGAAVVFLVLVGASFALVGGGKQKAASPPATTEQSSDAADTTRDEPAPSAEMAPPIAPEGEPLSKPYQEVPPDNVIQPLPNQPPPENRAKTRRQESSASKRARDIKKSRDILDQ